MKNKKELLRLGRKSRIRKHITGTAERPRVVVHRGLKNFYAQVIDDIGNRTIYSLSTMDKDVRQEFSYAGNIKAAQFLGEVFARKLKEKGITRLVFDRAGYLYHGRVKAFAEGLRKGGLEF